MVPTKTGRRSTVVRHRRFRARAAGVALTALAATLLSTTPAGAAGDPSGTPIGNFESATVYDDGTLAIEGWAIDPGTTAPIYLWVTLDGAGEHILGDAPRPDVAAVYPRYGANHGFSAETEIDPGRHVVCVTASNVGQGAHKPLGCRTVVLPDGSPVGNLETLRPVPGGFEVKGWAIDPDSTAPVAIRLSVDGATWPVGYTANGDRPDLARAFPEYGPTHGLFIPGWALQGAPKPGPHNVCVTAVNTLDGHDTTLGCATITVAPWGSPLGNWDNAYNVQGGIRVSGWAWDPDTTASTYVWVTLDGVGRYVLANQARPDVADAYRLYGSATAGHGFSAFLPAGHGSHTVCITASNTGYGTHTRLGTGCMWFVNM